MSTTEVKMVKLNIDGLDVEIPAGSTLIQATGKAGKFVPHFCYHPGLRVVGQCRMCFVEIEGQKKLATACSTPVADNMKVFTQSDKVKQGQNGTLEFTLLNHPLDCPICDRGGECKLQDYTLEFGPPRSRMEEEKDALDKHRPVSDQVILDQERCILCTRCERFSADVDGRAELVVNNRGHHNVIDVFEGRPMETPFSGNVVDLCPVGALTAQDFRFQARPWELRTHNAICTGCSVGCNVTLHTKHRDPKIPRPGIDSIVRPEIKRLTPRENAKINTWWMCDKGRWGYHFHNEEQDRLTQPMIRRKVGETLVPSSYRELQVLLEQSAQNLGPWEFWMDDSVPHEAISWAKDLMNSWTSRGRKVAPNLNPSVYSAEFLKTWSARLDSPWTNNPADWSTIKTVVAPVDYRNLESIAPILALKLGPMVRSGNLKWVVEPSLEKMAALTTSAGPTDTAFLLHPPKTQRELTAFAKFSLKAKTLLLFTQVNSRGLLGEGIAPIDVLGESLAQTTPTGPVFLVTQKTQNEISPKLLEYISKAPFLVVADSFKTEALDKARVVLPLTPLYESTVTFTSLEGHRQVSEGISLKHPNQRHVERGGDLIAPALKLL